MTSLHYMLLERHARVDDELRREQRRRLPDPFAVMRLKRMKLAIKDRLSALMRKAKRR